MSNAGLASLGRLTNLEELTIDSNPVFTDQGIAHLRPLHRLRSLSLQLTSVSDAGLSHLKTLVNLEILCLTNDFNIQGYGIVDLKSLPKLRILDLSGSTVDNSAITHLKSLKSLKEIRLYSTELSEAAVADLKAALPHTKIDFSAISPF